MVIRASFYYQLVHRWAAGIEDLGHHWTWRLASAMRRGLLPRPIRKHLMPTLHGFRLWIDPVRNRGVESSVYSAGTYERGALEVMRRLLRPGDRVLDAGANIGVFSLHAATCVGPTGRVWAVEAHPETAEILRRNVRENDALQIEVVNCALGANPGVAELFENLAANRGASSLIALDSSTRGQPVRVESIDRLWPDDRRLDLLKMDIEGSEVPALRGSKKILSRADAPWVICESSVLALPHADGEQQRAEIFHLLEAKGYRLFTGVLTKELTSRLRRVRAPEDMPRNDNVYGFTARHLRGVPQDMFVADDAPSGSASWSVI